ncbi:hypothetical protein H5410_042086 [Solanum commersonii]|uniref:Uncharacterized protein n=1 Tax=Solanum commersonii TaxID=4109 RepID=A0A9J5XWI5_SOLCO|nr:hypothetical protein H5410_042086 [Solanum commersonii]
MTEAFKRLNAKVEALLQENTKLMEQIKSLKGCAFPNECKKIQSDNKDTASPDQTVAGKDTSNPFMAVTLPKSEGEGSSSRRSGEEDYGEHSYYQDAQNPNADDDSGMSFDSSPAQP